MTFHTCLQNGVQLTGSYAVGFAAVRAILNKPLLTSPIHFPLVKGLYMLPD